MLEIQRPTHGTKPVTVTPLAFKARSAVEKDFFFFFGLPGEVCLERNGQH